MKKRKCPCCNEEIPIIYFIKHMFAGKKSFSFVEKEKGFICHKCNSSILSAEKKDKSVKSLLWLSWTPMVLFAFHDASFISIENLMIFLKAMSIGIGIFTIGVWRKYYTIAFICNDKSSDEYNNSSIHSQS